MNHDPMCGLRLSDSGEDCACCHMVRLVRADERNRCIQIVSGALLDEDGGAWNQGVNAALEYLRGVYE